MSGAAPVHPCRRAALFACAAACLATFVVAVAPGAAQTGSVVIGTQTVEPTDDANTDGKAEAFRTTASGTGKVSSLQLYLASSSSAATVSAGIYSDAGGHPGTLLAKGSASAHAGDWNAVPLASPVTVAEGTVYWIAILSPVGAGTVVFRDQPGGGASETSLDASLTDLPTTWSSGTGWPDGPLSAYGVADVSLAAPDLVPPSAPLGLTITSTGQTSVSLSWPAATDDTGVSGYDIYRGAASVGTTASTTFSVSGLACGTSYTFGVDAYDAAGNHSTQTTVAGATAPCSAPAPSGTTDTTAPSQPAGLIVSSPAQTSVSLSWSASTDNVAVAGYGVYANGVSVGSTVSTRYTFSSLSCGTTYTLAVDAYDAAGNRSGKAGLTATTSACSAVGFLLGDQTVGPNDQANSAGVAQAFRTNAVGSGRISALNVYVSGSSGARSIVSGLYSDAGGMPGTLLAQASAAARAGGWMTVPLPSSIAVSAGATYWVAVLAPRGAGTLVIRDFVGSGASQTSARSVLTSLPGRWKPGKAQTDGPISAYALSADLAAPAPTDTWPPSSPLGIAVTSATQSSVALSWTPSTDNIGVAGYSVYKNGAGVGSTTSTTYSVPGLACGTSYTFAVDAYDAAGNRSAQTSITGSTAPCADVTPPSVPSGLTMSVSQSSITLSWVASTDNVGVAGYGLYQNGSTVGSTSTTTNYLFTGLTCGTSYALAVDAFDPAGNRSAKASLSASTSICAPTPSGSGSANLWMDTNGGSCTRSATAAAWSDAVACSSLNAAYQAANPGDTIRVKGGSYGDQDIGDRSSLGSTPVVIRPAPGETATFSSLTVHSHDLTIDGGDASNTDEPNRFVVTNDLNVLMNSGQSDSRNVVIEDTHMSTTFDTVHGLTIRYGEIGPNNICSSGVADLIDFWPNAGTTRNMVLEYNLVHEDNQQSCLANGDHPDALQIYPAGGTVDNVVIRGNRFWWCGTQCIFLGDGSYTNTVVENNMVEESSGCTNCGPSYEVNFFSDNNISTGDVFQYNTVDGNVMLPNNAPARGNVFLTNSGCTGAVYSYNVFPLSGSTCGTNTKRCTPLLSTGALFTGDRNADWHLSALDTCARGAGSLVAYPSIDLDRQGRPGSDGKIDAGADQIP
jgi:chitodextrinase